MPVHALSSICRQKVKAAVPEFARNNHHATVVVIGDRGILIRGPSGAGKSSLAHSLIAQTSAFGIFARLVADDQVWLVARHGRLVAHVPATLAGLIEVAPLGPLPVPHEPACCIDLVIDLEPAQMLGRMVAPDQILIEGLRVARLKLSQRNIVSVTAALQRILVSPDLLGIFANSAQTAAL